MRSETLGTGFVELGRTFHEVTDAAPNDDADVRQFFGGTPADWADLLQEHRAVILSEAGAGKTEEIRQAAKRLRAEGKPAFFLRLEHVVTDFEEAFEEGTFTEFQAWHSGDAPGRLLLDSIDEVRLRDPRDFEAAVRRVGLRLSSASQRAHVILTGRTAAWRPRTDPQDDCCPGLHRCLTSMIVRELNSRVISLTLEHEARGITRRHALPHASCPGDAIGGRDHAVVVGAEAIADTCRHCGHRGSCNAVPLEHVQAGHSRAVLAEPAIIADRAPGRDD